MKDYRINWAMPAEPLGKKIERPKAMSEFEYAEKMKRLDELEFETICWDTDPNHTSVVAQSLRIIDGKLWLSSTEMAKTNVQYWFIFSNGVTRFVTDEEYREEAKPR